MKRTGLAALLALCLGVAARAADAPAPVAPSDVAAAPAPSSTPATTAPATSGTSSAPAATDAATANPQPVPAASPPPPKPQPAATASAPPAPLPPVSPYEKIHTVAIVSAIGTPVTLQNDHITGSTTKTLDGSDWKIDDQVASTLGQYLAGRFAIKDIAFDRAAFAKLPNDSWEKIDPQVSAFLASLPSAGVDAFVIVRPELDGEPGLAGLALEIGGAMGARPPTLWANYEIDIVDAQTHAILGRAHSCIQPRAGMPVSPAEILAAADLNLGDDLAPGDQQRTELKTGLSRLVSMSLLETVRALNLGAALPPVGTRNVVPVPDGQQPFPDVKTVAIVSAVGDVLQFEHVGATALSSNEEYLPIADWHLDGQIESQAKGILAKRFAVKEVAVDRAAFAGARLVNADRALRPSFPGLTPSTDVDAYIVFVKQPYRLPNSSADGTGVGVWNRKPVLGETTAVYAHYAVAVVDAHSLKLLQAFVGATSPIYPNRVPYVVVDDALWPDSAAKLPPDAAQKIHQDLSDMLTDSVAETLLYMRLGGMMVADTPTPPMAPATETAPPPAQPAATTPPAAMTPPAVPATPAQPPAASPPQQPK